MAKENGPKSWAEDVGSYRTTRGSLSYSSLQDTNAPKRYCRTNYVPFNDTRHKLYSYNDFTDGQGVIQVDSEIQNDRYRRHGWNGTSMLKQDGSGSTTPPPPNDGPKHGHGRRALHSPPARDGRQGLFGVLQMTEQGGADSWVGNHLVDPARGKLCPPAPTDPKGRRDLFDVITARNPGMPSDDSWLGHQLVDPAKGKAKTPGPEQRRGRKDLAHIFTQSILSDPDRLEKLKKGNDQFCDSWIGHALIDPTKGRLNPKEDEVNCEMIGAMFRTYPPGWSDQPKRHSRLIPSPAPSNMQPVIQQTNPGLDSEKMGKRRVPDYPRPNRHTQRKDLYSEMTYRPVSEVEQSFLGKAYDDGGISTRRHLTAPGSMEPNQAMQLLHHRSDMRPSSFVRKGGLAQENIGARSTIMRIAR